MITFDLSKSSNLRYNSESLYCLTQTKQLAKTRLIGTFMLSHTS